MTTASDTPAVNIALLGGGTVGSQVARILTENADALTQRIGTRLNLTKILVRNPQATRDYELPTHYYTDDVDEVFEDADIDKAVEAAVATKLRNMGEACNAADHFFVHDDVYDEFTEKFSKALSSQKVGDGTESGIDVGPLVSQQQLDDVSGLVDRAVEAGGSIETGGKRIGEAGFFFEPTVITNVAADAEIMVEEIFGPVAPIITFRDEKEALEIANDTEYGLASYVYTESVDRLWRISDGLEFGLMGANVGVISNAAAPFGGVKQSGMGREGGAEGLDEYTSLQYIGVRNPYASA